MRSVRGASRSTRGWAAHWGVLFVLAWNAMPGEILGAQQAGDSLEAPLRVDAPGADTLIVRPAMTLVVKPKYPSELEEQEIVGTVVLEVTIERDGTVDARSIRVVRSVHPELDRATAEALAKSRFSPATRQGVPVRVSMEIPYTFRFRDGGAEVSDPSSSVEPRFTRARIVHLSEPRFPSWREKGIVVLQFTIDEDGGLDASSLKTLASTNPEFERLATEAILHSEFAAARFEGRPVRSNLRFQYVFEVRESEAVLGGAAAYDAAEVAASRLSIGDAPPFLVFMPPPRLPLDWNGRHVGGSGIVRMTVTTAGTVDPASIEIEDSLEPELDEAVKAAARDGVFQVAIADRKPVAATIRMPYSYEMFR